MDHELKWVTPDDPQFAAAAALRHETLYRPLGLPAERDWNDRDRSSRHLIAVRDGRVVGYGRLILQPGSAQLRQLAVAASERGSGLGRRLVDALLERAASEGRTSAWVNARFTALGFWRQLGFAESDQPLVEAEGSALPHKRMDRALPRR